MTDTGIKAADGRRASAAAPSPASRTVRPRRRLPTGRAVVGAFLVATAVVGVFGAYLSATAEPDTAYAVAATALDAGTVIAADDVRFVPLDLPDAVRARSLVDAEALIGSTVVHARSPGELIHVGDVIRSGGEPGTREISFAVEGSRALGQRILPGERVDVLATYGTGDQAYTIVVVAHASVLRTAGGAGTLVGEDRIEFTLAVPRPEDALAVAHAVDVGQVTVVRSTNADRGEPRSYRPAAPAAAGTEDETAPADG